MTKKEICEWKNNYPSETLENIANKFEVSRSLISSVLKNKEKWLSKNENLSNQKRERGGKFPEVEAALYLWMQQALSSNIAISGDILKSKGLQFATKLQKEGFSGSDALDSIEKIIKYCKNPPDNFNVKMEELKAFNSMKEKIKRLNRESVQQVTLD
ncbi:5542_t:CDS:2, partial [Entrophospora sp. SA101]